MIKIIVDSLCEGKITTKHKVKLVSLRETISVLSIKMIIKIL